MNEVRRQAPPWEPRRHGTDEPAEERDMRAADKSSSTTDGLLQQGFMLPEGFI